MKKKQRLKFILLIVAALSVAAGLSLYALQDNVAFFFAPAEVKAFQRENPRLVAEGRIFRLGGIVRKGSVQERSRDLFIRFAVSDGVDEIPVEYKGLLPDLFREGQGVVAKGSLDARGVFTATELLAKHDENYMPPELKGKVKAAP